MLLPALIILRHLGNENESPICSIFSEGDFPDNYPYLKKIRFYLYVLVKFFQSRLKSCSMYIHTDYVGKYVSLYG